MRARRRRAALLLLAVGLLVVAAAPASAQAQTGSRLLSFKVHGSHGYRIEVKASEATATLAATRAKPHAETGSQSTYIARLRSGAGAIRATFGHLGSVKMRFRPSGPVTESKPQRNCIGPDHFTIHHGVFVGGLEFRGEGGYTEVKASRVKGVSLSPSSLLCGNFGESARASAADGGPRPTYRFQASFRSRLLAEFFEATTDRAKQSMFFAEVDQTVGSLAIDRLAIAHGRARAFATDSALSFATISPTAPFDGTGSLTRDPTGSRLWNGSLTVDFPGAPDVPLTGPPFKTTLTRGF